MYTYNDVIGTGPGRQLCTLGRISVSATVHVCMTYVGVVLVFVCSFSVPVTCVCATRKFLCMNDNLDHRSREALQVRLLLPVCPPLCKVYTHALGVYACVHACCLAHVHHDACPVLTMANMH